MFLPELLYCRPENINSFEGTPRFVEKHDSSQSMCSSGIGKTCAGERCIGYSSIPSSYCVSRSQHPLINDKIYEGDCGLSAYARRLNEVNGISNSFSSHHENNSGELSAEPYLKKEDESSSVSPNERGNIFLNNQDFVGEMAASLTAENKKGKRKPRNTQIAAEIPVLYRRPQIGFPVNTTARDLKESCIPPPSGSKDRHTKVLTLKGPRDRRIRLSVGTATKLYRVQDMLGFEQPSQAVDWLIGKSHSVIRELPQLSSISSSHISEYVESNKATLSVSCHETGDMSASSEEHTCTASGDFLVNLYDQFLAAKTCIGSKKHSIVQGEKKEQRSIAARSVSRNHRARETASGLPQKERRAKARERARERRKEKVKGCNQHSGRNVILLPSSVPPQSPAFSLQDNTILASSLDMMNELTDGNGNGIAFLNSLMFPKDSTLFSHSRPCVSYAPVEIQRSSLAGVQYSIGQLESVSTQSTGAFSVLDPEEFPLTPNPFPQASRTTNGNSSYSALCKCPLDYAHLKSASLPPSCREDSIEMLATYDGASQTSYEWQSSWNEEFFEEFQGNEEIPCLKSLNEFMPSR